MQIVSNLLQLCNFPLAFGSRLGLSIFLSPQEPSHPSSPMHHVPSASLSCNDSTPDPQCKKNKTTSIQLT